jgi:hypothetical protein
MTRSRIILGKREKETNAKIKKRLDRIYHLEQIDIAKTHKEKEKSNESRN